MYVLTKFKKKKLTYIFLLCDKVKNVEDSSEILFPKNINCTVGSRKSRQDFTPIELLQFKFQHLPL